MIMCSLVFLIYMLAQSVYVIAVLEIIRITERRRTTAPAEHTAKADPDTFLAPLLRNW
jgi:hypothetical protein